MHSIGYMLPHRVCWKLGTELVEMHDFPWALTIMFGWVITLTIALWAADIWTREVESRCVKFVKDLEKVCFVER